MVIRFWKGRARPEKAHEYRAHFAASVMPRLHGIDGFVSAELLERRLGDLVEFMVVTRWTSWAAIRMFAGDDPAHAVVDADAEQMLVEYDSTVDHFDRAKA